MSKENYLTLEKNLIHLFQHINKSKEIYIRKPDQRLGLHIIFKHQDIRSSIRIYATNKDNLFISESKFLLSSLSKPSVINISD